MKENRKCLGCDSVIGVAKSISASYTIYMCRECGNYSVVNEAIDELDAGKLARPNKVAFKQWLKTQSVREDLANQGPLVTKTNIEHLIQRPQDET